MKKYTYTCKYCGKENETGSCCATCLHRLPLVKHLQKQLDQLRELKRKREERRQIEK